MRNTFETRWAIVLIRILLVPVSRSRAQDVVWIEWDGRGSSVQVLASGVYLYVLDAGDYRDVRRMVYRK